MGFVVSGGRAVRSDSPGYASLRETVVDIQRQIEDLAWINVGDDLVQDGNEDDFETRKRLLKRIRIIRRKNPLAKQAVNLLKHYVLGQGIGLKANNKAQVARLVDEFMQNSVNQVTFTGHQAMQEGLDTVFTDGEIFLVLFPDTENGTLELGLRTATEVVDIIPDAENRKVARWYKVKATSRSFDYKTGAWATESQPGEFVYYRDWRNDPSNDTAKNTPPKRMVQDGLIYHVAINKKGLRGESELVAAVDWIVAHRNFMEDRSTLNKAAATFAWRKKRKGAAADIAATVEQLRSTLSTAGRGYETNPPPATASTLVENEGSTTEWVKTDTGGPGSDFDERKLRMMSGSGLGGVPNHYFGDEAQANLATATAMELPLLKTYEDWQALLRSVIDDLITFMLQTAHEAGRIGERDDSYKYAEHVTTSQKVITADDAVGDPAMPKEAGAVGSNPGAGSPYGATGALTMIPKAEPPSIAAELGDTSGPIDWYVDIDFPPIIVKDIPPYIAALKGFYELLPQTNIESQKLVVEMGLNVFGQNEIDQIMERVFPPGMEAIPTQPVPNLQQALSGLLGATQPAAPAPAAPGANGSAPATSATSATPAESLTPLAEYRVRRLLKAVSDTRDAVTVGG